MHQNAGQHVLAIYTRAISSLLTCAQTASSSLIDGADDSLILHIVNIVIVVVYRRLHLALCCDIIDYSQIIDCLDLIQLRKKYHEYHARFFSRLLAIDPF